jgi:hypothetical protein
MWRSILCHVLSYVWDLVLAHMVIMFAPGSWCPETRVWQIIWRPIACICSYRQNTCIRSASLGRAWLHRHKNQSTGICIDRGKNVLLLFESMSFFGTLLIWARLWTKLKHRENYTQQFSISKVTRSWPIPCPECRLTASGLFGSTPIYINWRGL